MGQAAEKKIYEYSDYLALEEQSQIRHEYFYGEIFAIAGTTDRHNEIAGNIYVALREKLAQKKCKTYMESVRLEVTSKAHYCYPDVFVTCNEQDAQNATLKKYPTLIVEVLFESTADYDRNLKWQQYQAIPNLQYYLLVEQHQIHVELYSRMTEKSWKYEVFTELTEIIDLPLLQTQLLIEKIYL